MEKYLPFVNGIYTTAPGLSLLSKATSEANRKVFQVDESWKKYFANKIECRSENIRKYYQEANLKSNTIDHVNRFLIKQLVLEHPDVFNSSANGETHTLLNKLTGDRFNWHGDSWIAVASPKYLSLFDAICSQLQEDVAVVQLGEYEGEDYLMAIHLCAPNHWSPSEKIGKPFRKIHEPVPAMESVSRNYHKMLSNLVTTGGKYTRFAWGISTDDRLNHHPVPPPNVDATWWKGRTASESSELFIRAERQNLIGLPDVNAFIFTIRTYFYPVDSLSRTEKTALQSALKTMSTETLHYKGLTNTLDVVLQRLRD